MIKPRAYQYIKQCLYSLEKVKKGEAEPIEYQQIRDNSNFIKYYKRYGFFDQEGYPTRTANNFISAFDTEDSDKIAVNYVDFLSDHTSSFGAWIYNIHILRSDFFCIETLQDTDSALIFACFLYELGILDDPKLQSSNGELFVIPYTASLGKQIKKELIKECGQMYGNNQYIDQSGSVSPQATQGGDAVIGTLIKDVDTIEEQETIIVESKK